MINELPALVQLLKNLQHVPYLASKNLYKVASFFLQMEQAKIEQFCKVLLDAKKNLVPCQRCFCWQQKDARCLFCFSAKRDQTTICVIETWYELFSIEKTAGYNGVYHVLGGVISPLDGVGPEELNIDELISRIDEGTKEVILGTNQTPEGEATAAFIANKLKPKKVLVSCLARGLPVGSLLGMMDRVTIYKALSERRPF